MSIFDARVTRNHLSGISSYTFNPLSASPNLPGASESPIALRSQLRGGILNQASCLLG